MTGINRLLAGSLVIALTVLAACKLTPSVSVAGAIKVKLRDGHTSTIKLSEITDFKWEKAFLFGPYTPDSDIQQTLGFEWPDVKKFGLSSSDTFWLLVFTEGKKVVRAEEIRMTDAVFTKNTLDRGFSPSQAVFSVEGRRLSVKAEGK